MLNNTSVVRNKETQIGCCNVVEEHDTGEYSNNSSADELPLRISKKSKISTNEDLELSETKAQQQQQSTQETSPVSKYQRISLDMAYEFLQNNMNTPLPEGNVMFPWLHSTNTTPLENNEVISSNCKTDTQTQNNPINNTNCKKFIKNNISVIRSAPPGLFESNNGDKKETLYIENSGILHNSVDLRDLFVPFDLYCHDLYAILENEYTEFIQKKRKEDGFLKKDESFSINAKEIEELCEYCSKNRILPILNVDDVGQCLYGIRKRRLSKGTHAMSHHTTRDPAHEPQLFRRFDVQCGKMLQMSSKIIVYCFNCKSHKNDLGSSTCFCTTLLKIMQMSLERNFERSGYIFPLKREFYIVDVPKQSVNYEHPMIGTPLMLCESLKKRETQLVSEFDATILNNWEKDLFYREKLEVSKISSASVINELGNVWCGNSIDYEISKMPEKLGNCSLHGRKNDYFTLQDSICGIDKLKSKNYKENDTLLFNLPQVKWSYFIHCTNCFQTDGGSITENIMNDTMYDSILQDHHHCQTAHKNNLSSGFNKYKNNNTTLKKKLNFPASGSLGLGNLTLASIKMIFQFVDLIYQLSLPADQNKENHNNACGDSQILIYSTDGYTETSLLVVAYTIYAQNLTLNDALTYLHIVHKRPFFLFPSDLQILFYLQNLLLDKSPQNPNRSTSKEITNEAFTTMFFSTDVTKNSLMTLKGPLPSRILDYLYLGSLKHAENYELLKNMGINCIISVGEKLNWIQSYQTPKTQIIKEKGFTVFHIDGLADNGKDPLLHSLSSILNFIEEQRLKGNKILIHCMVGVSRSATVVIAECMRYLKLDLLRAYIYVRVRRLNIIIQPNLMFMYELLKYEELLNAENSLNSVSDNLNGYKLKGKPIRSINWQILCKAVNELNGNYLGT